MPFRCIWSGNIAIPGKTFFIPSNIPSPIVILILINIGIEISDSVGTVIRIHLVYQIQQNTILNGITSST